jgi:hypothetical protein
VLTWIKAKDEPLYAFLTGGAGVGKSVVVKALFQGLHRYLCSKEGEDPQNNSFQRFGAKDVMPLLKSLKTQPSPIGCNCNKSPITITLTLPNVCLFSFNYCNLDSISDNIPFPTIQRSCGRKMIWNSLNYSTD